MTEEKLKRGREIEARLKSIKDDLQMFRQIFSQNTILNAYFDLEMNRANLVFKLPIEFARQVAGEYKQRLLLERDKLVEEFEAL